MLLSVKMKKKLERRGFLHIIRSYYSFITQLRVYPLFVYVFFWFIDYSFLLFISLLVYSSYLLVMYWTIHWLLLFMYIFNQLFLYLFVYFFIIYHLSFINQLSLLFYHSSFINQLFLYLLVYFFIIHHLSISYFFLYFFLHFFLSFILYLPPSLIDLLRREIPEGDASIRRASASGRCVRAGENVIRGDSAIWSNLNAVPSAADDKVF